MCGRSHHHHHRREATPEVGLRDEPHVRVSDRERERVVTVLRDHAGEGRLDVDELDARVGRAYAAATRAELAVLTADLPSTAPPAGRPARRRSDVRTDVTVFAAVNLLLIVIWAATGAGYAWFLWPLAFWGLHLAPRVAGRARRPQLR